MRDPPTKASDAVPSQGQVPVLRSRHTLLIAWAGVTWVPSGMVMSATKALLYVQAGAGGAVGSTVGVGSKSADGVGRGGAGGGGTGAGSCKT